MTEAVLAQEAALIALRHDIHQHPETSRNEARTAGLVAARLRALGYEVSTGIGGYGVVGILQGGKPGPMVAFRADMDAVPSAAPDPVAYRSLTPGVRHICGHDVHVTIGLGVAEAFAAVRADLAGSIMFIFQPAEESASGAKAMLADGIFTTARPDAVYAVHTAPYNVGTLGTAPGGMMAGRAGVTVTLRGTGNLSAAADSVRALIWRVNTIPPDQVGQAPPDGFIMAQPLPRPGRTSDGAGWTVGATVTTASAEARAHARTTIVAGVEGLRVPDVSASVSYRDLEIAGVTNDTALVSRANSSIRRIMGDSAVVMVQGVPPVFSEDFGSFQGEVPGVMYFLGVSNPTVGTMGMPHTDTYVADDAAILVGIRAMVAVLLDRLGVS
jgi:metal-dependent amidase/aminoacylase/carboxypeptidase family protein